MNPNRKFKSNTIDNCGYLLLIIFFFFAIVVSVFVLNPIHKKNIERLSKPALVNCRTCNGKGECLIDSNKLMMEARCALWLNHHVKIDKCEKCAKMPDGDGFCEKAENQCKVFLKEYAEVGPTIEMGVCPDCMGMGKFTKGK